ncbi:hypothetical protein N657DRAFT_638267 [Parathielavia appendiculata]|uniref:Uncharacterized protein n=1 Tax=Parathielavia appendiculata TaxID=2587402 RepID=A0AAN6TPA4_9PEZI|nr:hypothetical protein N657DRAFT_638267 [Parathielavia appendiculata]
MSRDNKCQERSIGITNDGTGYPICVTYDSDTVFYNQDIPDAEGGIIVKFPANTDLPGCGYMIASFSQPACAVLELEKAFMLQFSCGTGDCSAAGAEKARRSAQFGGKQGWSELLDLDAASIGMYSLILRNANGTEITPAQIGSAQVSNSASHPVLLAPQLEASNSSAAASGNFSKADEGRSEYTRPADAPQIIRRTQSLDGGMYCVTQSRFTK